MYNIDKIDRNILNELQKNCQLTTKELAQKVNLSPTPVFERVKRMEKEGYIKNYVAVLNPEKLDKNLIVFCNVRLKQHNADIGHRFMDAIMNIEEISECYNISGDFDFMLKIYVKNMKQYQSFVLNKLGLLDTVGNIESMFVLGEVKNTHGILLNEPEE
jgi:Lrp/AsnC family transcriptional regulator, leucine-responsive regulatory protein